MKHHIKSIRPFIGAKDYTLSRQFYRDLGFTEHVLFPNMCLFENGGFGFYLQDYYAKDWVDNTMVFAEVDDADRYYEELKALDLPSKFEGVKLGGVRREDWGNECFLHDPSGILWHFGAFKKSEAGS